ncbi:PTS cellobiose transporter subunit IIC [Desulfosarcina ovata subsp. sediminis]|uniref:PTS cellobiose transporter subunit IIC n=1 Tax=Desulfosarcina ovata subsp. sediminis TaxID=885957 RepID=A0A5K8A0T4_9BACT|nr:PTS cellobiose transporter subunit IIC [Desulfosarcina ovata subsp. sediminis]
MPSGTGIILVAMVILFFSTIDVFAGGGEVQSADDDAIQAGPVRLEDLIDLAYTNNPSIAQAREAWRATVEDYRVAAGYPDPQIMLTWFPEPIETRLGPQDWNAQITQVIPFPGKLSKVGKLVAQEARIARLKLDKAVKETILAIKSSYYELWYIRQAKAINQHNSELLAHIRKISETAHAQDRATLTDVVKAQSQAGQIQYDSLLLEELEQTEVARLNGLLDRSPDSTIGALESPVIAPLAVDVQVIYQLAEANQEEIQIAQVGIEKGDTQVSLARFQNMPDFKVGFFYVSIGEPDVAMPPEDAGRDAIGLQAGISIPLWFGKNDSRVAKALAGKSKARAERRLRLNNVRTEIRTLFFKSRNAQRIVTLYQTDLVPQAARSMELAETWYREGEASFTDFIESQSVWYNFQLALARATADYGINLAKLERMAGTPLTGKVTPPAGKEQP